MIDNKSRQYLLEGTQGNCVALKIFQVAFYCVGIFPSNQWMLTMIDWWKKLGCASTQLLHRESKEEY